MASNKECLIIVLDVRRCASEEFKLKSVKVVAEILKDKIVCDKKDYVSFVLVGAERSENDANVKHVVQYHQKLQLCNWELLLNFFEFVNEPPADEAGEWLDGLAAAMELQKLSEVFKLTRRRILLLFDFNYAGQNYDDYQTICNKMLKKDIELIVGSHNIAYIDNVKTNLPQAIFQSSRKATSSELENQKYALQLVTNCNAMLCNFKEALATIFKVTIKRPWTWSAKLHIGTSIVIYVQGIIAMKNEAHVKLKKVWAESEELVDREDRFFIKGTEVTPMPGDLVDGYMLGGTPVPYDETLAELPPPHPPGLHFVGFVKRNKIPDAYFTGDSLYMLVHQKDNTVSAQKLDALVRALVLQKSVILCWKIFSVKFNTPRLVVLLPHESTETRPAALYMLELSYHAQHQFWDFPALRTEKTECSPEQLQAVDKLIDSMDLECTLKDTQQPRQQRQNDLLPFDGLPSIYEQNVMDVLERKVILKAATDTELQESFKDKNFVDVFWRVPEPIEQQSKEAAAAVQKLFHLERSYAWQEKLKAMELKENAPPPIKQEKDELDDTIFGEPVESVGLVTPVQDYNQLLREIRKVTNCTRRDVQFQELSAQMRVVLMTLLERKKLDFEQLTEVLKVLRSTSEEFNSFPEYNMFAKQLRAKVIDSKLTEFWQTVVVDKQLGPIVLGTPVLDDELRLQAFYALPIQDDSASD